MTSTDLMREVPFGMADGGIGDYFITDEDELLEEEDELLVAPVVVPPAVPAPAPGPAPSVPPVAQPVAPVSLAPPVAAPAAVAPPAVLQPVETASATSARPAASVRPVTREERLVGALDELMAGSPDIQAAALVSMDGFTMASALPDGMQEDRVGAMSAAILGLGERAAAELGRGHLSEVFIEGDDGYVVLIAAGERAVLTALAGADCKLGLVLYDMKTAAGTITEILG
jgi:hypothetical protein